MNLKYYGLIPNIIYSFKNIVNEPIFSLPIFVYILILLAKPDRFDIIEFRILTKYINIRK